MPRKGSIFERLDTPRNSPGVAYGSEVNDLFVVLLGTQKGVAY